MPDVKSPDQAKSTSIFALFLRIFWMFVGNIVLVIAALFILKNQGRFLSVADAFYLVTAPLIIAARYVDITRYEGATAYGEPATMGHWRKHALTVAVVAAAAWGISHAVSAMMAG